jgi:hypothetical protein
MMDAQRGGGNGSDVVQLFTTSNSCSTSTAPKADVPTCSSTFDHMQVTPGCVTYQNCTEPTVWCSHNDIGYNSTDGHEHGWPCFASSAIADFSAAYHSAPRVRLERAVAITDRVMENRVCRHCS